jgi:hypothetical protein
MTKSPDAHDPELSDADAEMPGLCDASDSDGECARLIQSLRNEGDDLPDLVDIMRLVALDICQPFAAHHRRRVLLRTLGLGETTEEDDLFEIIEFLSTHFGIRARDDVVLLTQITTYLDEVIRGRDDVVLQEQIATFLHDHPDKDI